MNLTHRPVVQKRTTEAKDPDHLAKVSALPCVICHEWNMPQLSRTAVHHCIHGRHGNRKVPDSMTIPLCEGHHQGLLDTTKIALHREPSKWKRLYGEDHHWISWVEARI